MEQQTKGEAMIMGIKKIREGLEIITQSGTKQELVKTLVGSKVAATRLKDIIGDNSIFQNLVISLVCAKNGRLNPETISKVISDFLDIVFDLSQPYAGGSQNVENQ